MGAAPFLRGAAWKLPPASRRPALRIGVWQWSCGLVLLMPSRGAGFLHRTPAGMSHWGRV